MLTCSLLSLSLGFFASVIAKRSSTSIALSYLFGIAAYLGSYLTAAFFGILLESAGIHALRHAEETVTVVCFFSPVLALFYGWYHFGLDGSDSHVHLGFLPYWGSNVVLTVLFSLVLIRFCIRILERRMRDE